MNAADAKKRMDTVLEAAEQTVRTEQNPARRATMIAQTRRTILRIQKDFQHEIDQRGARTIGRKYLTNERKGLENRLRAITETALQQIDSWNETPPNECVTTAQTRQ